MLPYPRIVTAMALLLFGVLELWGLSSKLFCLRVGGLMMPPSPLQKRITLGQCDLSLSYGVPDIFSMRNHAWLFCFGSIVNSQFLKK